jgi:drug/metabolite transporter (DMT)-like permease
MVVGIVVLAPLVGVSTAQSGVHRETGQGVSKNLWSLRWVALAGIASGIAVISLYFAVQRTDVVVISPIVSSSPLITLLLSHLFLARLEQVTRRLVFGAMLTVGGVVLVVLGNQI